MSCDQRPLFFVKIFAETDLILDINKIIQEGSQNIRITIPMLNSPFPLLELVRFQTSIQLLESSGKVAQASLGETVGQCWEHLVPCHNGIRTISLPHCGER